MGVVGSFGFVWSFVGGGVEENLFFAVVESRFAKHTLNVVAKVGGFLLVVAHYEMPAALPPEDLFGDKSLCRPCQSAANYVLVAFGTLQQLVNGVVLTEKCGRCCHPLSQK